MFERLSVLEARVPPLGAGRRGSRMRPGVPCPFYAGTRGHSCRSRRVPRGGRTVRPGCVPLGTQLLWGGGSGQVVDVPELHSAAAAGVDELATDEQPVADRAE